MSSPRVPAWLVWGVFAASVLTSRTASAQSEPVKPYIVFILDTSGSMDEAQYGAVTGFGPPSCPGTADTRQDHAKCAINNVANSYGEMVLALGRFRATTNTAGTCATECSTAMASCGPGGDEFQVVVPLLENNQEDIIKWTDFVCDSCNPAVGNPEIYSAGNTPLAGALVGAKRYWRGANSPNFGAYWSGPGDDPIVDDPLNDVFSSPGQQCRPYITILLTDGDANCDGGAGFAATTDAATALLTTDVDVDADGDLDRYRIITKPIGFGKPPGDDEIEAIAHAGGAVNDNNASTFEGAYAQNEEQLQLEISRIIADAIKFELCNEVDDDCDGFVDEGYVTGTDCDDGQLGLCRGTGTIECNAAFTGTECVITDPGSTATTETCNGLDDNCDGNVDEGNVCPIPCSNVELCNGRDDDCNGIIDDDLTQPCGTPVGLCTVGVETCNPQHLPGAQNGTWQNCTGVTPVPEECDGDDNDCDGVTDGFSRECVDPTVPDIAPCDDGFQVCPTDGSGTWGPCQGQVEPADDEGCDTIDNDCDGTVDEDTGGGDCSSGCGLGTIICENGTLVCDSEEQLDDDTCNGIDDDCDELFDENAPDMGSCNGPPTSPVGSICDGTLECQNGGYVCVGDAVQPELCNCENDDCDASVDEDPLGTLCPANLDCVHPSEAGYDCQCAETCDSGEFPCPVGRNCVDGYCLVDRCAGVTCSPDSNGDQQECLGGACVRSCDITTCPSPLICFGPEGECRPDDCTTFPNYCTADELCVGGACVADACAQVTCDADEYCVGGDCAASCAGVDCPDGQRCQLGACEASPCGATCPGGDVCHEASGECRPNPCANRMCPGGQACNPQNGICEQDPCLGVTCPGTDQVCRGGSCFGVDDLVDAGVDADLDKDLVTAGGGGGCQAGDGGGLGAVVLLLGLALATRRRRRPEVRS